MGKVKQIEIKNRTYYFYNEIVNIEDNSSFLKIDKKSYKDIDIYYIGYMLMKKIGDYENIYSVNPSYLTNGKVDGHIKESNENIYFLILQMKTKKYLKNTLKFGMVLKMKLKQ